MKTCIYARRSTSKLGQNETIGNQIKICQSHAERMGLEIVDIKEDTGTGTDDLNRPQVRELIDGALEGKYECVIMKGISRFYRDTAKGLELVNLLDRNNIRVITIEESYDSKESRYGTGRLDNSRIAMFLTFSEMESRKLGDRIKFTQLEKAKAGEWNQAASVPYGYKYNANTKKLQVNRSEAEVIKLIFNLYIEKGYGIESIAKYLEGNNEQGKKYLNVTTYNWSYSKVRYILTNKTYTGAVVFNKRSKKEVPYLEPTRNGKDQNDFRFEMVENDREEWIVTQGAHEAIISHDTLAKAKSILDSRANNRGAKRTYSLLSGIAKCGKCGGGMYLNNPGIRNGRQRPKNYCCVLFRKRGSDHCSNHKILQEELEGYVFGKLKDFYSDKEILDDFIEKNLTVLLNTDDKKAQLGIYKKEINEAISKSDLLLEKNLMGDISDTQFQRMNQKYTKEIKVLDSKIQSIKNQEKRKDEGLKQAEVFKKKLLKLADFDRLSHEQKRVIVLDLVEKVVITPTTEGKISLNVTYKFGL